MTRSNRRRPAPFAPPPPGGRFRPTDRVVLVVILVLASALAAAKVPPATVLEVLAGAGGVATGLLRHRPALRRG
ncbi:hypothetical protein ACFW1A_27995 [Kitasatospora sp. NPDC058965]|uniref:hypothetical protein n=1 Tax=Kitasatospora sp. NPDC058965 TaxID=3346682 RepID=UPI00367EF8AD